MADGLLQVTLLVFEAEVDIFSEMLLMTLDELQCSRPKRNQHIRWRQTGRTSRWLVRSFVRPSIHPSVVPISPSVMQLCLLEV